MRSTPFPSSQLVPFLSGFTAVDWVLAALLLWSTVAAFFRGAIRELVSLLSLIAGILLASWNYPKLIPYLAPWMGSGALTHFIAFLLILSAVLVLGSLAGRLLRSGARAVGLGLVDRLAGAALGVARGLLAGAAALLALTAFLPPQLVIAQSRLAPYLLAAAHGVSFVVPQELKRQFALGAAALMHTRASWIKPLPGYDNQGPDANQDPK